MPQLSPKQKYVPNTTTNKMKEKPKNFVDEIKQLTHEVEMEIGTAKHPMMTHTKHKMSETDALLDLISKNSTMSNYPKKRQPV